MGNEVSYEWCSGRDLNPRLRLERLDKTPTVSYYLPFAGRSVNWEDFEVWLLRDHKPRIARDMVSYAKRYCHYLFDGDFSELKLLSDGRRRHVLKSLSALAKYLGVYEDFKRLVRNYGIKWVGKSSAEILGHRKLDSTLLYIQIEKASYQENNDQFHVAVARTPEEIKKLLEVGFEYVCEKEGLLFFRKRK